MLPKDNGPIRRPKSRGDSERLFGRSTRVNGRRLSRHSGRLNGRYSKVGLGDRYGVRLLLRVHKCERESLRSLDDFARDFSSVHFGAHMDSAVQGNRSGLNLCKLIACASSTKAAMIQCFSAVAEAAGCGCRRFHSARGKHLADTEAKTWQGTACMARSILALRISI